MNGCTLRSSRTSAPRGVGKRVGAIGSVAKPTTAHFAAKRGDLIAMVPPVFPRPDLLLTLTGVLEFAGAVGLLVPATARLAAGCLAALLLVMFPANVYAARRQLTIGGQKVPALLPRA